MKRLVTVLFFLLSLPLSASHIVGGEIELLHLQGFSYRINLIYYFDVRNNPNRNIQQEEGDIDVYIYRKSDNRQMMVVNLLWLSKKRVQYSQPHCSQQEIINDKIIYTNTVTLSPELFGDPAGYYITWARCCRNYTISNIYSQDPTHAGAIGAGQTFYMEFPAVTKNGQAFVNSSPKNFPALKDYACPTKPYYVDFAGVDDDGDSLAYTLTTPLSTVSVNPVPDATPAPYPLVQWLRGYGLDKSVNGDPKDVMYPDLGISINGFLRVTPRSQGLYVFAVKVEEYRNKVKIGESRRDFQMLVTDCALSVPPVITGKELTGGAYTPNKLSVKFSNTTKETERCVIVRVTDLDATRVVDSLREVITLQVAPLNFKSDVLTSILPKKNQDTIRRDGAIEFRICFPKCPYVESGPYRIAVIAYDDACALPLTDTLQVEVEVEPPHNERVKFVPPDEIEATLQEGDKMSWTFEARDAEKDTLQFSVFAEGYSPSESGMRTKVTENKEGVLKGIFDWDAFCDIYDFTKRTDFTLKLLVDDLDVCRLNDPDTLTYNLRVILPTNADPIVDTDLTDDPLEIELGPYEKRIYDQLSFKVTGTDLIDNRLVKLHMVGDGFLPSQYGMSFPAASAVGSVSSVFTWNLVCDKFNLDQRSEFNIGFVAIDSTSKCRVRQTDSLVVKVKVLKPLNTPPQLSIVDLANNGTFKDGNAEVSPGQQLQLQFNVIDPDILPKDNLSISMTELSENTPDGWSFSPSTGPSVLSSVFSWTPLCSIFEKDEYEHDYYFDFRYSDDRCLTAVADTIRVNVKVKDVMSGSFDIEPANVFTPNGDGFNDYYSMERYVEGKLVNILPPDNCRGAFQYVRIYNRWGKAVFTSSDRNFKWLGLEEAAGVYFYHLVYTNRDFKGTVSLRD
ncbi:MAG TPA: gliding motility-associated C-terminal domain-containing protein [Cyclobacteriaceae bacterium]|nr:gliding motility-associated C-terminal domain-containing protein [Cyclobacteriaceae bacterium]